MKKSDWVIRLVNLSKVYRLYHEKPTLVENILKGGRTEMFAALKGINMEIYKGEKVGIIGANGSGKTTLLKIISGIAMPTKGKVFTRGKLVSLIDLSAGFHPELSGRENIFLNALLIGMGRNEVKGKYRAIVEFAGIGGFIDSPLYTYSNGMKLRLGFSVAVAAEPDILILDEGIAVGDEDFQKKSAGKVDEFFKQKKTIILVSHWMSYLRSRCTRVIKMKNGKLVDDGQSRRVIAKYMEEINGS